MANTEVLFKQKNPPNTSTVGSIKNYLNKGEHERVFRTKKEPKEVMVNGEKVYEYKLTDATGHKTVGHFYLKEHNGVVEYIQDKKAPLNKEQANALCVLAVYSSTTGVEFDTINTNPKIKDAVEDNITDSIKAKVAKDPTYKSAKLTTVDFNKAVRTDVLDKVDSLAAKFSGGKSQVVHHDGKVDIVFGAMNPEMQSRMIRTPLMLGINGFGDGIQFKQDEHKNLSLTVTPENLVGVAYMLGWMQTELENNAKFNPPAPPKIQASTPEPKPQTPTKSATVTPERFGQIMDKDIMAHVASLGQKNNFSVIVNTTSSNDKAVIKFGEMSPELQNRILRTPGLIGVDTQFTINEHNKLQLTVTPENIGRVEYMLRWMTTELQNNKKFEQHGTPKPITSYAVTSEKFTQIVEKDIDEKYLATLVNKFNFSAIVNSGNDHAVIKLGPDMTPEVQSRILKTPGLLGLNNVQVTKDEHNKLLIKVTPENIAAVQYMLKWMTTELGNDAKFKASAYKKPVVDARVNDKAKKIIAKQAKLNKPSPKITAAQATLHDKSATVVPHFDGKHPDKDHKKEHTLREEIHKHKDQHPPKHEDPHVHKTKKNR